MPARQDRIQGVPTRASSMAPPHRRTTARLSRHVATSPTNRWRRYRARLRACRMVPTTFDIGDQEIAFLIEAG
jgi:hypothetical protein